MKRNAFDGPFAGRTIKMMKSPAWRLLTLAAHRILDRLEIEIANHGGNDNGETIVTKADLLAFGIHDKAIPPAERLLEALGFITIDRGRAGNGSHRAPNRFRLTYRPTATGPATDEWKAITSLDVATTIARASREPPALKPRNSGARKNISQGWKPPPVQGRKPPPVPGAETTPETPNSPGAETTPTI